MAQIDYTDSTAFPPFTSKEDLIKALLDFENEQRKNNFELAARVANSNFGGFGDGAAANILTLLGTDAVGGSI